MVALVRFAAALRRQSPVELWIGDSHAQHYNWRQTPTRLFRGPDGQFVYHHGPRLMHSVATRGFERHVVLFARWARRLGSSGRVVVVFSAGEIDVRCHLVPRSGSPDFSLDFVDRYLERVEEVATILGASRIVVAMHPPASPTAPDRPAFPVRGGGRERIAMSERLRQEVHGAVDRRADLRLSVLDPTDDLSTGDGGLRPELTDDQIHTNEVGQRVVRQHMRRLLEEHARPG